MNSNNGKNINNLNNNRPRGISFDKEEEHHCECQNETIMRHKYLVPESNSRIYSVEDEIHFTEQVDDDSIETLIKEFNRVITRKTKQYHDDDEKITITYIVDSPGGSVLAILKFVDYIRMMKKKHSNIEFVSVITGMSASAGTIMCMVADKRKMTKYAKAMIHELSAGMSRTKYTFMHSQMKLSTNLHNDLVEIYLDNLKNNHKESKSPVSTKEELETLLREETWFTSQEYFDKGFVHEIL